MSPRDWITACSYILWKNGRSSKRKCVPPFNRADARAFPGFFSGASEADVDKQGRVLIPANLRKYARLEKEVVIIGVSSRVEIWSKEVWEDYNENTGAEFENIAEKLDDLSIPYKEDYPLQ